MWTRIGRRAVLALLCVALMASGCRSAVSLSGEELRRLDGFEAGEERTVYESRGRPVSFTAGTPLTIYLTDGRMFTRAFVAIAIEDDTFRGTTEGGEVVAVPISDVSMVMMSVFSLARTAVLLGILGGFAILLIIASL